MEGGYQGSLLIMMAYLAVAFVLMFVGVGALGIVGEYVLTTLMRMLASSGSASDEDEGYEDEDEDGDEDEDEGEEAPRKRKRRKSNGATAMEQQPSRAYPAQGDWVLLIRSGVDHKVLDARAHKGVPSVLIFQIGKKAPGWVPLDETEESQ